MTNPHKRRSGVDRIVHATGYSIAGLRAACDESAFRQELCMALVLLPLALWMTRLRRVPRVPNRSLWGANVYRP
ncbi:MAG: diacylglycerol kinase [Burkholderiaceae bacterium]